MVLLWERRVWFTLELGMQLCLPYRYERFYPSTSNSGSSTLWIKIHSYICLTEWIANSKTLTAVWKLGHRSWAVFCVISAYARICIVSSLNSLNHAIFVSSCETVCQFRFTHNNIIESRKVSNCIWSWQTEYAWISQTDLNTMILGLGCSVFWASWKQGHYLWPPQWLASCQTITRWQHRHEEVRQLTDIVLYDIFRTSSVALHASW